MENLLFLGVPILKHIRVFGSNLILELLAVNAKTAKIEVHQLFSIHLQVKHCPKIAKAPK